MTDFEVEFTDLPKGLDLATTIPVGGMSTHIPTIDDPTFCITNIENRSIQTFLQDWLGCIQSFTDDKSIDTGYSYRRINGHLVKLVPVGVDGHIVTSELVYHPFITAYFKRMKYSRLRYKYLKMKGLFRNVRR